MIGHKTKVIFFITLTFLVFSSMSLWWMMSVVLSTGEEATDKVTKIADSLAQEHKFQELIHLAEQTESVRDELEQYILAESDTINFLAQIEKVGVSQGVGFEINSLTEKGSEADFKIMELNITMDGSEDRLIRMVKIFENLPYHSEVVSYKFSNSREGGLSKGSMTFQVSLVSEV